tara:strand:+ start:558 stop:839 length:282 start_codon:yes stop_codon:yes gene_type:complete
MLTGHRIVMTGWCVSVCWNVSMTEVPAEAEIHSRLVYLGGGLRHVWWTVTADGAEAGSFHTYAAAVAYAHRLRDEQQVGKPSKEQLLATQGAG